MERREVINGGNGDAERQRKQKKRCGKADMAVCGGVRWRATASCPGETKCAQLWEIWQDDGEGERQRYQDNRGSGGGWRSGVDGGQIWTEKGDREYGMM